MTGKWQNPDGTQRECLKPDCEQPIRAQGLCRKCYNFHYYLAVVAKPRKTQRRDIWGTVE